MGLKSTDFGPFGTITLKLGTCFPLAIAFANSSALSFHSLGIRQKTTFAPCRWNCRTAVRKSFHKSWFLMGDDSPCRLIPFHPGFSQRSRHYKSHRGTKEHACRFSTCTGQPPNGFARNTIYYGFIRFPKLDLKRRDLLARRGTPASILRPPTD
jgi:hypothetical protein